MGPSPLSSPLAIITAITSQVIDTTAVCELHTPQGKSAFRLRLRAPVEW